MKSESEVESESEESKKSGNFLSNLNKQNSNEIENAHPNPEKDIESYYSEQVDTTINSVLNDLQKI